MGAWRSGSFSRKLLYNVIWEMCEEFLYLLQIVDVSLLSPVQFFCLFYSQSLNDDSKSAVPNDFVNMLVIT